MEITKEELEILKGEAKANDFKDVVPTYPKNPTPSTISGYKKRLSNWVSNLYVHLEQLDQTIKF